MIVFKIMEEFVKELASTLLESAVEVGSPADVDMINVVSAANDAEISGSPTYPDIDPRILYPSLFDNNPRDVVGEGSEGQMSAFNNRSEESRRILAESSKMAADRYDSRQGKGVITLEDYTFDEQPQPERVVTMEDYTREESPKSTDVPEAGSHRNPGNDVEIWDGKGKGKGRDLKGIENNLRLNEVVNSIGPDYSDWLNQTFVKQVTDTLNYKVVTKSYPSHTMWKKLTCGKLYNLERYSSEMLGCLGKRGLEMQIREHIQDIKEAYALLKTYPDMKEIFPRSQACVEMAHKFNDWLYRQGARPRPLTRFNLAEYISANTKLVNEYTKLLRKAPSGDEIWHMRDLIDWVIDNKGTCTNPDTKDDWGDINPVEEFKGLSIKSVLDPDYRNPSEKVLEELKIQDDIKAEAEALEKARIKEEKARIEEERAKAKEKAIADGTYEWNYHLKVQSPEEPKPEEAWWDIELPRDHPHNVKAKKFIAWMDKNEWGRTLALFDDKVTMDCNNKLIDIPLTEEENAKKIKFLEDRDKKLLIAARDEYKEYNPEVWKKEGLPWGDPEMKESRFWLSYVKNKRWLTEQAHKLEPGKTLEEFLFGPGNRFDPEVEPTVNAIPVEKPSDPTRDFLDWWYNPDPKYAIPEEVRLLFNKNLDGPNSIVMEDLVQIGPNRSNSVYINREHLPYVKGHYRIRAIGPARPLHFLDQNGNVIEYAKPKVDQYHRLEAINKFNDKAHIAENCSWSGIQALLESGKDMFERPLDPKKYPDWAMNHVQRPELTWGRKPDHPSEAYVWPDTPLKGNFNTYAINPHTKYIHDRGYTNIDNNINEYLNFMKWERKEVDYARIFALNPTPPPEELEAYRAISRKFDPPITKENPAVSKWSPKGSFPIPKVSVPTPTVKIDNITIEKPYFNEYPRGKWETCEPVIRDANVSVEKSNTYYLKYPDVNINDNQIVVGPNIPMSEEARTVERAYIHFNDLSFKKKYIVGTQEHQYSVVPQEPQPNIDTQERVVTMDDYSSITTTWYNWFYSNWSEYSKKNSEPTPVKYTFSLANWNIIDTSDINPNKTEYIYHVSDFTKELHEYLEEENSTAPLGNTVTPRASAKTINPVSTINLLDRLDTSVRIDTANSSQGASTVNVVDRMQGVILGNPISSDLIDPNLIDTNLNEDFSNTNQSNISNNNEINSYRENNSNYTSLDHLGSSQRNISFQGNPSPLNSILKNSKGLLNADGDGRPIKKVRFLLDEQIWSDSSEQAENLRNSPVRDSSTISLPINEDISNPLLMDQNDSFVADYEENSPVNSDRGSPMAIDSIEDYTPHSDFTRDSLSGCSPIRSSLSIGNSPDSVTESLSSLRDPTPIWDASSTETLSPARDLSLLDSPCPSKEMCYSNNIPDSPVVDENESCIGEQTDKGISQKSLEKPEDNSNLPKHRYGNSLRPTRNPEPVFSSESSNNSFSGSSGSDSEYNRGRNSNVNPSNSAQPNFNNENYLRHLRSWKSPTPLSHTPDPTNLNTDAGTQDTLTTPSNVTSSYYDSDELEILKKADAADAENRRNNPLPPRKGARRAWPTVNMHIDHKIDNLQSGQDIDFMIEQANFRTAVEPKITLPGIRQIIELDSINRPSDSNVESSFSRDIISDMGRNALRRSATYNLESNIEMNFDVNSSNSAQTNLSEVRQFNSSLPRLSNIPVTPELQDMTAFSTANTGSGFTHNFAPRQEFVSSTSEGTPNYSDHFTNQESRVSSRNFPSSNLQRNPFSWNSGSIHAKNVELYQNFVNTNTQPDINVQPNTDLLDNPRSNLPGNSRLNNQDYFSWIKKYNYRNSRH